MRSYVQTILIYNITQNKIPDSKKTSRPKKNPKGPNSKLRGKNASLCRTQYDFM